MSGTQLQSVKNRKARKGEASPQRLSFHKMQNIYQLIMAQRTLLTVLLTLMLFGYTEAQQRGKVSCGVCPVCVCVCSIQWHCL